MAKSKERLYTTEELLTMFRVSRFTLTRAINNGKLRVIRDGKRNLFPESAVKEYVLQSNGKYTINDK